MEAVARTPEVTGKQTCAGDECTRGGCQAKYYSPGACMSPLLLGATWQYRVHAHACRSACRSEGCSLTSCTQLYVALVQSSRGPSANQSCCVARIFPPPGEGASTCALVEDDGLSHEHARGARTRLTFELRASAGALALTLRIQGAYRLPYASIRVCRPSGETRPLTLTVEPWAGGAAPALVEGPFRMHALLG